MTESNTKSGLNLLGIGAAACLACCAGPLLAFLGGLSIAGLASTLVLGAGGLLVAVAVGVAYLFVRRRRSAAGCALPDERVLVAAPTRRTQEAP